MSIVDFQQEREQRAMDRLRDLLRQSVQQAMAHPKGLNEGLREQILAMGGDLDRKMTEEELAEYRRLGFEG